MDMNDETQNDGFSIKLLYENGDRVASSSERKRNFVVGVLVNTRQVCVNQMTTYRVIE